MNSSCTEKVLALSKQTKALLARLGRNDLVSAVEESESDFLKSEKTVLVCGEFKRGKSSLIGGLLGRYDVCPVDADIATSVVSVIRYGEKPAAWRHFGDIGGSDKEEIPFPQLAEYATGRVEGRRDTWLIEVEIPCGFLENGVVLVDTPGVGGLDPRHGFLTSYFLPRAGVIVFVADPNAPLSDSELAFLRDKVAVSGTEIVVALNKTDCLKNPEAQLGDMSSKIAEALEKSCQSGGIVSVSSRLMAEYVKSKDRDDLQESGFEELLAGISSAIERHDDGLLSALIGVHANCLNEVRVPLQVQLEQLSGDMDAELIDDLKERLVKRKAHIQELMEPRASWHTLVSSRLAALRQEVLEMVRIENINISASKHMKALMEDESIGKDPNTLLDSLARSLESLAEQVDHRLVSACDELVAALREREILDSENDRFASARLTIGTPGNIEVKRPSLGRRTITYGRNIFAGTFFAKFSVGVISSLTNPLLGAVAGLYVLYESGRLAHEQLSRERVHEILDEIRPELEKANIALNSYVGQRLSAAEEHFRIAVDEELHRARTRYEEISKALEAVLKRNAEQRKEFEKIVKTQLGPIEQLLKYYDRLSAPAVAKEREDNPATTSQNGVIA